MTNTATNHWFKKIILVFGFFALILVFVCTAVADLTEFKSELISQGYKEDDINKLETQIRKSDQFDLFKGELTTQGETDTVAEEEAIKAIINTVLAMKAGQDDISAKYDELKDRVGSMNAKDTRKDAADDLLKKAKSAKNSFAALDALSAENSVIEVQIGNVPPLIVPSEDFAKAEEAALSAMSEVNKILIAPVKPGNVPEGDILEDFAPQLIRQLFRFAWLAIFISFVVSGVMFVTSIDNEEQINKAKRIIYFTFLGFAFVTFAFAIVKAVTNIDFFGFI
jgi:hypothetical protein